MQTKRYLALDGERKRDVSISTKEYIQEWWRSLEEPSVAEGNFYKFFSAYGEDLSTLPIQFCRSEDKDAFTKAILGSELYGRCHSIGHKRLEWGNAKKVSSLWLGYVDIYEHGVYTKTIKHTFLTWNVGELRVICDFVLCKVLMEKPGITFINHFGVCVPDNFPLYVEDMLESVGKKRSSKNYSVFLDHVTLSSDRSAGMLFAEMDRLRFNEPTPSRK